MTADPVELTHADAAGRVRMVDVGAKPVTGREARAVATVTCSAHARELLRGGRLAKGDGLAVARVAGIQAAKRTSELIPLCHLLGLDAVEVDLQVADVVSIAVRVATTGRTGAEMEALVAAAVAGLTVIDMIKAVDRGAALTDVRVVAKSGGASGSWSQGARVAAQTSAGVVTVSDRSAAGTRPDLSGPVVTAALERAGATVITKVVGDDVDAIRGVVGELLDAGCRFVVTTGGTGLAPRDVTPEALAPLLTRTIPGLAEGLRAAGARQTPSAVLSRSVAGLVERDGRRALVAAVPGSPAGAADAMAFLAPLLAHIADQMDGADHFHLPQAGSEPGDLTAPSLGSDPRVVRAGVGPHELDPGTFEKSVRRAAAGATVTFTGVVRDHDGGRTVASLDYEAHPSAADELRRVVGEWLAAHDEVQAVATCHRTGALQVGDVAFVACVAAAHRAEAFAACAELVDRVKAEVPVWKRERFADGSDEWVNA